MSFSSAFFIAALICMGGVVFSLIGGLAVMTKNAPNHGHVSNRFMRWRLGFQGLAILLLFMAYVTK